MNLDDQTLPTCVIRMTPPDQQFITGNRAHSGHSFTPVTSIQAIITLGAGPGQGPKAQGKDPAVRSRVGTTSGPAHHAVPICPEERDVRP
jgi:hypothetical protein